MQNFIKTIINSVRNWVKGEIKKSKADWNQNDSSADNYVKNRTHWEEDGVVHKLDSKYFDVSFNDIEDRPFGKETIVNEYIFKPQTVEFSQPHEGSDYVSASFGKYLEWDKTYFISIDDIEYEVTIDQSNGEEDWGNFYIDDNILVQLYYFGYVAIHSLDYEGAHKISIYNKVPGVTSLDLKYLPEQLRFGLKETILFEGNITLDQYHNYNFEPDLDLVVDQEYTCIIDDIRYTGVCYWHDTDGNCCPLKDSDDNIVGEVSRYNIWLNSEYFEAFSSHDVKICIQDLQQIDKIYLPDSVAMDADVEMAQTTADNAMSLAEDNSEKLIYISGEANYIGGSINSIAGGNGYFLLYNNNTQTLYGSTDGKSWEPIDISTIVLNFENCSSCLNYVNNKFMLVFLKSSKLYVYESIDGKMWTNITTINSSGYTPDSVTYGNGVYILNSGSTNNIGHTDYYYSSDGLSWNFSNRQCPVSTNTASRIVYLYDKFVAWEVKTNQTVLTYSTDGIQWSSKRTIPSIEIRFMIYGDNKYIASTATGIYYSTDLVTWTASNLTGEYKGRVAYGDGQYVCVYDENWYYSEDGITWNKINVGNNDKALSISYINGRFLAYYSVQGVTDVCIWYSEDGINWSNIKELGLYAADTEVTDTVKEIILKEVNQKIDVLYSPQPFFTIIDSITNNEYIIYMKNGNLTSICKAVLIAITTLPNKIIYLDDEEFDTTGMVITVYRQDGTFEVIENYDYEIQNISYLDVVVSYNEFNNIYTVNIKDVLASNFETVTNNDNVNNYVDLIDDAIRVKTEIEFTLQSEEINIDSGTCYTIPIDTDILNNVTIHNAEVK